MSVDLAQEIGIKFQRLLRPQRPERLAEAAVVVPLFQAVMQPGHIEPGLQGAIFRIFVQRFFVFASARRPSDRPSRACGRFPAR